MKSASHSSSPDFESTAVYAQCCSDDTAVQAAAYRILWPYLYRIAAYMTASQPDGEALAQDCAQRALLRIRDQLAQCQEPKAFRTWCRRIVSHLVIDELRKRKRLQPLEPIAPALKAGSSVEGKLFSELTAVSLRELLNLAPISDRSRRVVIGRYLDDLDDSILAQTESELSNEEVRPSHVQVTRAKNISKLRQWETLHTFLRESTEK